MDAQEPHGRLSVPPPAEPSDERKQGLWSVVDYLRLERRAADAEKHIIQQRLISANGTIELLNKKLKDIEKELREEKVKATSSPIECFWADGTGTKFNKTDDLVSEMKILSQKNNTLKTSSIYQQIEIKTITTQLKDEIVKIEEKQKVLETLKSQLAIAQAEKVEADREHLVWKEKMDVIVQNFNILRTEKEAKDKETMNVLTEQQAATTHLQKNYDDLATEVKVRGNEAEGRREGRGKLTLIPSFTMKVATTTSNRLLVRVGTTRQMHRIVRQVSVG
ncbi:hypothetical protein BLNAU_4466 [Blattamonas nauphoetae]|uniref:Uncharacterized protein n=1 Tax=Blattamonas nauphoetae TaxID=2049346 RepID=A0ABQ9Y9W4_9EUKA|nr:hypothetical protein BLNAU_4466 [Blattamonas nauphoetae]